MKTIPRKKSVNLKKYSSIQLFTQLKLETYNSGFLHDSLDWLLLLTSFHSEVTSLSSLNSIDQAKSVKQLILIG